jgi:hypothetical protein
MSIRVLALSLLITLGSAAWTTTATDLNMLLIAYTLQHAHRTLYATVTRQRRKPEDAADRLARALPVKNCSTTASFSAPRPESAHARAVRSASSPTRFCSAESPPSSLICKSSSTSASTNLKADEDEGWVFKRQPANILGMESASRPW